jgi:hypothetical protein
LTQTYGLKPVPFKNTICDSTESAVTVLAVVEVEGQSQATRSQTHQKANLDKHDAGKLLSIEK